MAYINDKEQEEKARLMRARKYMRCLECAERLTDADIKDKTGLCLDCYCRKVEQQERIKNTR